MKTGDVVYTPAWVVADMVAHFEPAGRVLDPCRGAGAFTHFSKGAAQGIREVRNLLEVESARIVRAWD